MADLPAAPNRFRAGMLRYRNLLLIPEVRSYYLLDVNDMEQIQEFVEALREIGAFKKVEIEVGNAVFRGVESVRTHAGIHGLCKALCMTNITAVSLIGNSQERLWVPQWKQDRLTSIFLRKGVARNSSVRELSLQSVRVGKTFALVLRECSNLRHVQFHECEAVNRAAHDPVVEAFRECNVESLDLEGLKPFEARILAAARGFTKLKALTLWLCEIGDAEWAFFKENGNTLESLSFIFYRIEGLKILH